MIGNRYNHHFKRSDLITSPCCIQPSSSFSLSEIILFQPDFLHNNVNVLSLDSLFVLLAVEFPVSRAVPA